MKAKSRLIVLALVAGLALTPLSATFADPQTGSPASCRGFEADAVPPGSNAEEPNGQQSFLAIIHFLAALLGVNSGTVISAFAQLHLGSHEACDAGA